MWLTHHDRVNQTVPNAMHTIKDCIEKLVYLTTGMNVLVKLTELLCLIDKTDDKSKVIQTEAVLGRFQFHPAVSSSESVDIPWILTKD